MVERNGSSGHDREGLASSPHRLQHPADRYPVVLPARDGLVDEGLAEMRAVDVAKAAVALVDVVEGDPSGERVSDRLAPEVGVVLVQWLGRAQPRRLEEHVVPGEEPGLTEEEVDEAGQPGVEYQRPELGCLEERPIDL